MRSNPVIKLRNMIYVLAFFGFSHGIINTASGQSQNYGGFNVQLLPEWNYSDVKSAGDFYVFLNSQQKIEVAFKKEPAPCLNPSEFTKLILPTIQNFQKEQWIIEQRKPAVPYSFAGQNSCHFMKLKSRGTGQQKFVLNPLVKNKMYQIEITSETLLTDPPSEALNFIAQVSTTDSPATAAKKNVNQSVIAQNNTSERPADTRTDDDLSGFTKVKNAPTASSSNSETLSTSSTTGISSPAGSSEYDSAISVKAASIPDGDEQESVVNPIGTVNAIPADAGWALGLAKNPKPLLDALEGGRPGGEVSAMMALLRQAQGPLDENEDQSLMKQYAAQSASGSSKSKQSIRQQSEMLLKAMINKQLMTQAAWEYDFAIAQNEIAGLMQDKEELEMTAQLAEMQKDIIQDQQSTIENIVKQVEAVAPIPTPEELAEELQEENANASKVALAVGNAANSGKDADKKAETTDANSEVDAMVSRYFALRDEHRILNASCNAGNTSACTEATAIYREAMDIRKKLEAKGIDVLNYKKPEPKPKEEQTPTKEEPLLTPSKPDPNLTPEQNQAIAEHEYNIIAAQKSANAIRKEMAAEKDPERLKELRFQALHMDQNAHDSKDLIESIRTGTIVKTRGPWDEHAAVTLAETSRKLREDFQRASQMQATYVRMLNVLKKYNPQEAEKYQKSMSSGVIKGIYEPGGFAKAQQALDGLYASTKGATQSEQKKLESQQTKANEYQAMVERHLGYVETLKSGCDKAIFVGTLFTGLAPGLALSMAYEGATTGIEKGPKEAMINMAKQGATMLAMAGVMKAGSWGIGKLLNPKVAQSEINTFKNILDANKYKQEMEWNQALVNQLKEKATAFERCKALGGKNYLEVRKALDDAVSAANSSGLAKRIMKNELTALENQAKSGLAKDLSKLNECASYQKVFDNRLQKNIYPRADAEMISKLRSQGYNVEKSWFQEYRNACSRGVNADRDLGLLASVESKVAKNGQPVSMGQFMDEAQKAYDSGYKSITGRSSKLADQSITTSAHSESFPLSWLQKKVEGPFSTVDPPVSPQDFEKAGKAIYNKVQNALTGSDPAFVKMKKACSSLSKDLKTKVLENLKNPPANAGGSPASRQAALQHWEQVQKVMEDFSTDKCDPLTTMKKLQQLTGTTSISQSAAEIKRLLNNIGGA
ncbi:MAG: hypothetical protein Q8N05_13400 [Bacteroidota bacterium]|nr:hypothetical protein [Bacteroidota bacterium]